MPIASSMHSKCPNTPCVGAQCRVRRVRSNTMAPRLRNKPTKPERRLASRIDGFNQVSRPATEFHRPGSKSR